MLCFYPLTIFTREPKKTLKQIQKGVSKNVQMKVYQIIAKFKTHPSAKKIKSNKIFQRRRNFKYQPLPWISWQKSAWKGYLCKAKWIHLWKINRLHKLLIWGRPVPKFFKTGKYKINPYKRWAWLVSVLHLFSKTIESVIRNQLSLYMGTI